MPSAFQDTADATADPEIPAPETASWIYVHAKLVVLKLLLNFEHKAPAALGRAKCRGPGQCREAGECFSNDHGRLGQLLCYTLLHAKKCDLSIRGNGGLADADGVSLILWSGQARRVWLRSCL